MLLEKLYYRGWKVKWGEELLSKLEDIGYVGLGFGDFGFRHTTNAKQPIKTVDDFNGLKIRTMSVPIHLKAFEQLGAKPTPMAFSELFSALQQGVVDGQENPLSNIYSNKLHEVQPYLTLDGHVFTLVLFAVDQSWFNSLSEEHQVALKDGAKIASEYMKNSVISDDETALEKIKEYGVEVIEMSNEEKVKIKEKVKAVNDEYGNSVNKEMYEKLINVLK